MGGYLEQKYNSGKKTVEQKVTKPVAKKAAAPATAASKKVGGILSKVSNAGPLGKIANLATGGQLGAAGSVMQGKDPIKGTVLDKLTGGILPSLGSSRTGGAGGGGGGGLGPDGRPEIPAAVSALTPGGILASQYQMQAGPAVKAGALDVNALKADPRALDAMRERAMATGDSAWLKMQLGKQGLEELSARDQAAQQSMTGGALARSALAMKGGLGGGSAERIARGMGRDLNATQQSIGRAGQLDRLNLGIADDQTKTQLLGQTAGLDLSHAGQLQDMNKFNTGMAFDADKFNSAATMDANRFNAQQTFNALQADNLGKFGVYSEKMKGFAAGKQGDAIANSGKK